MQSRRRTVSPSPDAEILPSSTFSGCPEPFPPMVFLKTSQGSHIERGITLTSRNSSCAPLGRVAASHGHRKANDLASPLKTSLGQRDGDYMGNQRIRSDYHIGAGYQRAMCNPSPNEEELPYLSKLILVQRRKSGKRRSPVTIERGGHAPDATFTGAQFALLFIRVFVQSVGRIRHDGMYRIGTGLVQPGKAIVMVQNGLLKREGRLPCVDRRNEALPQARLMVSHAIHAASFADEEFRGIEPQIGPDRRGRGIADPLANTRLDVGNAQRRVGLLENLDDGIPDPPGRLFPRRRHSRRLRRLDVFSQPNPIKSGTNGQWPSDGRRISHERLGNARSTIAPFSPLRCSRRRRLPSARSSLRPP